MPLEKIRYCCRILGIVQAADLSGNRASGLVDRIIYGLVDNFRGSWGASVP